MSAVAELPRPLLPEPAGTRIDALARIDERKETREWRQVGEIDRLIAQSPQITCPLRHVFTPGLYAREITMPGGAIFTTRIHLFEHPFVISKGRVSVWSDANGWETLEAPHLGVTSPATRRVLHTHEETIWTTFHVTNGTDPDKLVDELTFDPMKLGHLDDLTPKQRAAVQAFCRTKKELTHVPAPNL